MAPRNPSSVFGWRTTAKNGGFVGGVLSLGAACAQPVRKTCDADQTGASQASRKHGMAAQAQPAGHKPIQGESRDDAADEAQGLHSDFFDHSLRPEYVSRPDFSHLTFAPADIRL